MTCPQFTPGFKTYGAVERTFKAEQNSHTEQSKTNNEATSCAAIVLWTQTSDCAVDKNKETQTYNAFGFRFPFGTSGRRFGGRHLTVGGLLHGVLRHCLNVSVRVHMHATVCV